MQTIHWKKYRFAIILYSIILLFLVYIVWQFILTNPRNAPLATGKHQIPNFPWAIWESVLYLHITCGILALVIGPFQFVESFRKRNIRMHRLLGSIYIWSILISFPISCYLAYYATGGVPSTIAFTVLNIFWITATILALKKVKERNIAEHQNWMLRSYAITWVFVTFRMFMPLTSIVFGFKLGFPIAVWVALISNILFIEWRISKRNTIKFTSAL
ncbi:DUF2306 domain-containing protein [Ectobacillus sp. sgz5001026]|uniref:DUF2306 domain-containing protein n=1 Tax=Ectobacillus sp. sgz5001026 TaxID=3242473 RepID=UPI0036D43423